MALFTIDETRCKRDGICVAECPAHIIEQNDPQAPPTPSKDAAELCINCGHCVAVCPHGAFSLATMPSDACRVVDRDLLPSREQLFHLMLSRRSVRVYKKKPVGRETIAELLDVVRYAPSGHNAQPVNWLILHDSARVQHLAGVVVDWMRYLLDHQPEFAKTLHLDRVVDSWENGIDRVCRGAPHVVVAHAPADSLPGPAACTIALTWLELIAPSFGLGACWAGYFHAAALRFPPMQDALGLPKGHSANGAMMLGYPKWKYHRIPERNPVSVTWR